MAARDDEDDLFKHTSMTFGEHLEELRSSLFKAVLALVIGFAVALAFGSYIVSWIQTPLTDALTAEYQKDAIDYVNSIVPPELRDNEAITRMVYQERLLPEIRFVSPAEMLGELKQHYPAEFSSVTLADKAASAATAPKDGANGAAVSDPRFTKANMIRMFFWRPISDDERLKLDALNMQEPFIIYIKASFLAGAVISSPFVFYFLWQFVAAGLYPHEKKYIHVFLPFSLALFLFGAALAFFFVFPPVLNFFFRIGESLGVNMRPRLSEWLSFVLLLPLGFGVAFQLPLVMLFLERIRVFTVEVYLAKWKIAVLLMSIAAMVLSPGGDPYSMLMMLAPLILLYFGGIGLCKWLPANRPRENTKPEKRELAGVD